MIGVFIAGCALLIVAGVIIGAVLMADDEQTWRRFDE